MGSQAVTPWHSNLSKLAMSSWSSSKENTSRLVACLSGLTDLGRGTKPFCRLHLIKTYMQEVQIAKLQSVNLAKDQVCHDDWMTAAQSMQAMFCKLGPISSYAVILSRSRAARVVSGESRSTGNLLSKRSTSMLPAFECGSCMTCCKAGTQHEAVTARKLQYYTKLFMHTEKSLVHFQCRSLLAVCTARYVLC